MEIILIITRILGAVFIIIVLGILYEKITMSFDNKKGNEDAENKKATDGSEEIRVSWEYMETNLGIYMYEIQHMSCPKCELESDNLHWFKFSTSNDSWKHLAGRKGFYSKCPNCQIKVDEIITLMN